MKSREKLLPEENQSGKEEGSVNISTQNVHYQNDTQVTIEIDNNNCVTKILTIPEIENIVLKGAGMRGIAYRGVIDPLFAKGIVQKSKRIVGTSAGSLMGLLLSLGLSYKEIEDYNQQVDLKELVKSPKNLEATLIKNRIKARISAFKENESSIEAASKDPALEDGEKLLKKIRQIINERVIAIITNDKIPLKDREAIKKYLKLNNIKDIEKIKEDVEKIRFTFADLQYIGEICPQAGLKELTITGVKLEGGKSEIVYFNAKSEPGMEVALAVRISTSIPYFFQPVKYKGAFYIDGGCLDNFPITYHENAPILTEGVIKNKGEFDQNLSTLGIYISDDEERALLHNRLETTKGNKTRVNRLKDKVEEVFTHSKTSEAKYSTEKIIYHQYSQNVVYTYVDPEFGMAEFNASPEKIRKATDRAKNDAEEQLNEYRHPKNLMEYKKYNSFKEMCENMEEKELERFCKILDSKNVVIINKGIQDPVYQEKAAEEAKKILKKKKLREPMPAFLELYKAIKLENYEMISHTNERTPQLSFRTKYLTAALEMADGIKNSDMKDEMKAQQLLKWTLPALENTPCYEHVAAVAEKFKINIKTLTQDSSSKKTSKPEKEPENKNLVKSSFVEPLKPYESAVLESQKKTKKQAPSDQIVPNDKIVKDGIVQNIIDELQTNYIDKRSNRFFNFFFLDSTLTSLKKGIVNAAIDVFQNLQPQDATMIKAIIKRMEILNLMIEELKAENKINFENIHIINDELKGLFISILKNEPCSLQSHIERRSFYEAYEIETFCKALQDKVSKFSNELFNPQQNFENDSRKKYRRGFSSRLGKVIDKIDVKVSNDLISQKTYNSKYNMSNPH